MDKTAKLWLSVFMCIIVFGVLVFVDNIISPRQIDKLTIKREQQHIVAMENGADPSIGDISVSSDGIIDETFVSHLPLVVIDLDGQEIPVTKETTEDQQVIYTDEDPYVYGSLSIIDNEGYINCLHDEPSFSNLIKIKYRGNYSLNFEKKQYGIKLVNDSGESVKESILGMEANNDWVLNVSQLDKSLIRNYLAYNLGSALFEGTPECKYCEVVINDNGTYIYQGVYLMMEKVEKGKGRVELDDYVAGDKTTDYLLCRDRENIKEIQISTYGDQVVGTNGRLSVVYPDEDVIDEYAFDYIQSDIDSIERVLYSDDKNTFASWPEYIDTTTFVDYFLFNELFGNYDAGDNSTYMYKYGFGKLCMGPVWDYDGSMDNAGDIANPEALAFYECPWYERLVTSKKFMDISCERYKQLSAKGELLSDEYITSYILDVSEYLGNAALRDRSRWGYAYDENIVHDALDSSDNMVSRDSDTWNQEVNRLCDYFVIKELYMSDALKQLYYDAEKDNTVSTYFAIVMLVAFGCAIVLIRRRGLYK